MKAIRFMTSGYFLFTLLLGFGVGFLTRSSTYIPASVPEIDVQAIVDAVIRDEEAEAIGENVLAQQALMDEGKQSGYFFSGYEIILCNTEDACTHEVGHWLDKHLGRPSRSRKFRVTVDVFIEECERVGDSGDIDFYCNLQRFPGINDNALYKYGWGGYGEAYAEVYKYDKLLGFTIPSVLVEFYMETAPMQE